MQRFRWAILAIFALNGQGCSSTDDFEQDAGADAGDQGDVFTQLDLTVSDSLEIDTNFRDDARHQAGDGEVTPVEKDAQGVDVGSPSMDGGPTVDSAPPTTDAAGGTLVWGAPVAQEQGCDLWAPLPLSLEYNPPAITLDGETWLAAKNGTAVVRLKDGVWSLKRGPGFMSGASSILRIAAGTDWVAILVQRVGGNASTNRILWRSTSGSSWTDISQPSRVWLSESRLYGFGADLVVVPMDGTIQAFDGNEWRALSTTSWESTPSEVAVALNEHYFVRLGRLFRSANGLTTEVIATIDRLPPGSGSDPIKWQHVAYTGSAFYASGNNKLVYRLQSGVASPIASPDCATSVLLGGGDTLYAFCDQMKQLVGDAWVTRPGHASQYVASVASNGDVVGIDGVGQGARLSAQTGNWTNLPIAAGPKAGRVIVQAHDTVFYAYAKENGESTYTRLRSDDRWEQFPSFEGRQVMAGLDGNLVDKWMVEDDLAAPTGQNFYTWANGVWNAHLVPGSNQGAWPFRSGAGVFLYSAITPEYSALQYWDLQTGLSQPLRLDCFQHRGFGYFGSVGIVTSGCVGVRFGRRTYGRVEEFDGMTWSGRDAAEEVAPRDLYQIGPAQMPQVWLRRPGQTSVGGGAVFDVRSASGWSVRTLPAPATAEPVYLTPPEPVVAVLGPRTLGVSSSGSAWKVLSPWFLMTRPVTVLGFHAYNGNDSWTDGRWFWATTPLLGGSVVRCDLATAQ